MLSLFHWATALIALVLAILLGISKGKTPFLQYVKRDLVLYYDFMSFMLARRKPTAPRLAGVSRQTKRRVAREYAKRLVFG